MIIRRAEASDHPTWATLLAQLHNDQTADEFEVELNTLTALDQPYVAFLAFADGGRPIGMIDARVRNYAEGAPDYRAAYVEDLWVEPQHRGKGVATGLLRAVEDWARGQGLSWLGSDALIDNRQSHLWHRATGFEEVERLVVFGKPLKPAPSAP